MGLFKRMKALARLASAETADPARELGDLVEPGSVPGPAMAAFGDGAAGAAGLDQVRQLHAAGLIDADTFKLIETSMANAPASASASAFDAAELELLQHGEPAPATILAVTEQSDGPSPRLRMTLEVHPATGPAYEVDHLLAPAHPAAKLKAGDFLQVMVDPADHRRVAIVPPGG
jgi:hypothetical protein